ncbi:MAG: class I SAM-dependent methyltransferase [Gemmatimonadota bacterium]|nr:class I SAM-dependent methyltransferase [Gemmatimonadota bacterium]
MARFAYASAELDSLAEAENYYRWILNNFAHCLNGRIVEVGAGIGTFAERMLSEAPESEFLLIEPADNNFPLLRHRFANSPRVRIVHGYLDEGIPDGSADTIVAVNVMEHIQDDEAFLRAAHRCLSPNGNLLLFVPALPQIFGTLDQAFEHFRRYTRPGVVSLLRGAGFRIARADYVNLPGALAWWLSGKVFRRRTVTRRDVRLYDRWVIPWVSAIERRWSPPFGQSLLVIATRTESVP